MTCLYRGLWAVFVLIVAGCGGLQEMWEGPSAESFKPKTIAVLPPMVGAYEGARDTSQGVLISVLGKSGRYQMIAGLDSVNGAFSNKENSDLLAAYYSKLETTGQSDKDMAMKLGQLVQADAILVPKVNNWEYGRAEGDSFGKVGLGLRLIDTSNGGIVWKGRHEKVKTYMVFKPALKDIAEDLSEYMVKYLPK
jgi:PBP1b-binding outer membrane lipoprotein LpoB